MPTRASKPKRPRDVNLLARSVVEDLIGETMEGAPIEVSWSKPEKNPAAVALSMLGASKGGQARALALSPRKRKMIAKKAAEARWKKYYELLGNYLQTIGAKGALHTADLLIPIG